MDTKNNTQHRVAVYARVSTQEQAVEGVSIDAQVAALKANAKIQGWETTDVYIDGGYSGGTDERPALKRLLADAKQHRFNVIAVCKLDRFFRNLRLLLNHLHGLEQLGIKFISTQEGLDTSTPYGKFAVQMMGVIAEFERGRIGERVRDSRRYLVSNGNWPGGKTLYGYRWLAEEKKWEVVLEEAETVQRIYHLYLDQKKGMDTIARAYRYRPSSMRTRGSLPNRSGRMPGPWLPTPRAGYSRGCATAVSAAISLNVFIRDDKTKNTMPAVAAYNPASYRMVISAVTCRL